jgi:hypothetical protein
MIIQNGTPIYHGTLTGKPFNFEFAQPGCVCSYRYINLDSSSAVSIMVTNVGSLVSYFNYDLYSSKIDRAVAALILYPAQWGVNFSPGSVPMNNGISFTVTAPRFENPTSLAMWVLEGGPGWSAQVGYTTITTNGGAGSIAYPFFEVFPGGSSAPGGQDYNYPLVPGDRYTFTMKEERGDTWEFLVDNTLIETSWPSTLNGTYPLGTPYGSQNADFAVESFPSQGGGFPNVATPIRVDSAMQFEVDGKWEGAESLALPEGAISENWHNSGLPDHGVTSSHSMSIWGIAGNNQDASIAPGSAIFGSTVRPKIVEGMVLFPRSRHGQRASPRSSACTGLHDRCQRGH